MSAPSPDRHVHAPTPAIPRPLQGVWRDRYAARWPTRPLTLNPRQEQEQEPREGQQQDATHSQDGSRLLLCWERQDEESGPSTNARNTQENSSSSESSLMSLPPELLLLILEYVGLRFFREDTRRLAVCKGWYQVARRVFASELVLRLDMLPRFTSDGGLFRRIQSHVRDVRLSLGLEDPVPTIPKDVPFFIQLDRKKYIDRILPSDRDYHVLLPRAAKKLQQCPGLRSLSIVFWYTPAWYELILDLGLLDLEHLTSLEIDGMVLPSYMNGRQQSDCLGCRINKLLPKLRRLRFRMYPLCHGLLESSTVVEEGRPIPLEELIVNIDYHEAGARSKEAVFQYFNEYYRWHDGQPMLPRGAASNAPIRQQAAVLAWHMARPRMVRVIQYNAKTGKVYAFDALTGRRSLLPPNKYGWDCEGKVVAGQDDCSVWEWRKQVAQWVLGPQLEMIDRGVGRAIRE
ncbi:uncharacterized protein B0T15DRAFT_534498 [Chaetomium strumarium]|uniref:F-box domain-containing protein n=1 Tax=Chaetomium strumarium TaxID=1170767 RepID=A0AAJ0M251_9PEZI|nr:hypothetical protein B0T15DRAFT_534498 [Chaetomium strumarium]